MYIIVTILILFISTIQSMKVPDNISCKPNKFHCSRLFHRLPIILNTDEATYNFRKSLKLILILSVTFFISCEKDITVDLPVPEEKLVIEGYINPGSPAYVFISKTAPFFAPVDSATLVSYAIKDAIVTVSDGVNTDTLVAPLTDLGYLYISPNITGEIGKTYFLKVETTDGKIATAVTQIFSPVPLDSVWFKVQEGLDTLGWTWARISDDHLEIVIVGSLND